MSTARKLKVTALAGGVGASKLLLGLYDADGKLDHVGFTSTITEAKRPALTRNLEKLRGPPGFTGKAPGGPSRCADPDDTDRPGIAQHIPVARLAMPQG